MRLFKTRTLAVTACQAGRIKIMDLAVKPARMLQLDEVITVVGEVKRTLKVLKLIERRVSATEAKECMQDLTPPEEYARAEELRKAMAGYEPRAAGLGRPTKRDRRALTRFEDDVGG